MIELKNITFTYKSDERHSGIYDLNLIIPTGQVVILCGQSGCGKTTLTRLINGLIPEYYDGELEGNIIINGKNVKNNSICDLAGIVGSVFQNPRSQFFNVDSTSEIAFGCENMGIAREEIYNRIGKVSQELNIKSLLDRNLFDMSGGEKQKIACASVSAMKPDIFVLDEPSSNLDIKTISGLKTVIKKWKKQGKTVIIAEHRLYYLMDIADRVIYMKEGRIENDFSVDEFKNLSEKELHQKGLRSTKYVKFLEMNNNSSTEEIRILDFSYKYDKKIFLDIPKLDIPRNSIVAILGFNGAGKSTFARCLCGIENKSKGVIEVDGTVLESKDRLDKCYMVMQDVNHQLFTESVEEEILLGLNDTEEKNQKDIINNILQTLNLDEFANFHPMSLSGGQKQRVAIASAMVSNREILIFDEPTSGLDYQHMIEVSNCLKDLSDLGKTIFVITHDPELIKECCTYFMYLEKGKVGWSGFWTHENKKTLEKFFMYK